MVADSPLVRQDGPGACGAPHGVRSARTCLARLRSAVARVRTLPGGLVRSLPARRPADLRRRLRLHLSLTVLAVTVTSSLSVALVAQVAAADALTDRRAVVSQAMAQARGELNESSHALANAGVALARAQSALDVARAQLAQTRTELAAAQERDVAMAAKLKRAQADLKKAKAAVVAGQKALDAKLAMAGDIVRNQYQQQTNLMPIAILVENMSSADLQQRLQWSTTMVDTTGRAIDELKILQARLESQKARQAALETQVAADRAEAAATLDLKQTLEARATAEEAGVSTLVQQRAVVQAAAAGDVAADKAHYARLTQERASVEQRIANRIAQAKAQEAVRKAADQRARQATARRSAARAAAEARRARQDAKSSRQKAGSSAGSSSGGSSTGGASSGGSSSGGSSSGGSSPGGSSSGGLSSGASASHGFSYPVSAPITSPYGMRLHPVLHVWKLHDGTDFGAGCGTAIRAPYAGRVAEQYFNAGYGNRLMIDHGMVDGRYVTTGYNHAIRYTVSVGQQVSKGQVIGYVGTTGYSTGCHLHLMVWINGGLSNPMTWF